MIELSIFEEDQLRPIAVVGGRLTCFSSLDGALYHVLDGPGEEGTYARTSLDGLAGPFCLPGVPYLYEIGHDRCRATVRETAIVAGGLGAARSWRIDAPDRAGHDVAGIVPDARGGACVVFAPAAGARSSLLVDLHDGALRGLGPHGASPAGVLADGTVIAEHADDVWSMRRPDGSSRGGGGSIVSVCSAFALVRRATRTSTTFEIVQARGVRTVEAPHGWRLVSAAASEETLLAYAVHPALGQRLLVADPGGGPLEVLERDCGTAQVFSMHADARPVARCTGLRGGSWWRSRGLRILAAAKPLPDVRVERVTINGLPCVLARGGARAATAGAARLVVCLHGGPDSHELDDLRYGGAYRDALARGHACLIVNYAGSAGLGTRLQTRAWRAWDEAVRDVAAAVGEVMAREASSDVVIVGASFGAWLGLQVAERLDRVVRVVALSPILDLAAHIRLHAADDPTFGAWAAARFGDDGAGAAGGDARARACRAEVVVLAPADDEVVAPAQTRRVVARARAQGLAWVLEEVPGGHYPQTASDAAIRFGALARLAAAGALAVADR